MIEAIRFARVASQQVHDYKNELLAAAPEQPALVRRRSARADEVKIQVPRLFGDLFEAQKPAQAVLIDTGNDANAEEAPLVPTCEKIQKCGHLCYGAKDERKCPPCLHSDCADKHYKGGVNADELCGICYTSELGAEACSRLSCGHVFHTGCIVQLLEHGWSSLRITFAFMSCPSCKHEIELAELPRPIAAKLGPLIGLKRAVEKLALENAEKQGILQDARVAEESGDFYGRPQAFANFRCSVYQCHGCKKPYFGGLIDCEQEMANQEQQKTKKEDLLCQDCLLKEIGAGKTTCDTHGTIQIDWKCMYCCSTALYCCFGTHYMCFPCHEEYNRSLNPPLKDCHGINCPLGIPHPPPNKDPRKGGVFPLGCGICRSEKLEVIQNRDVQQVVDEANLPKHYVPEAARDYRRRNNPHQIERPLVEIEVPDFVVLAEEIAEQERQAEAERIRRLNNMPVPILTPAQRRKKEKALRKKQLQYEMNILSQFFAQIESEGDEEPVAAAPEKPEMQSKVANPKAKQQKVYKVMSDIRPRKATKGLAHKARRR